MVFALKVMHIQNYNYFFIGCPGDGERTGDLLIFIYFRITLPLSHSGGSPANLNVYLFKSNLSFSILFLSELKNLDITKKQLPHITYCSVSYKL
jgi:hypothetical protein